MKRIIPALAFALASSAWAEGGYIGIGVGQAKVKDIEVLDFGPGVSTSVDDEDTSFKFFGGYQFNDNFAAEIAYENIGQMSVKYDDGIDWVKVEAEATSLTLSALGLMPVNNDLSFFGRFGFAVADVDAEASNSLGESDSTSGSSTNPVFGLGIQYDMPNAMLRAEFNRYTDVGDNDTGESDIDVFGISAGIKF